MKIGIPLFGQRVSPHFATAPELLVALAEGRTVYSKSRFDFSKALVEKRRKVLAMGIETLFCGGIDSESKQWFEERGIRVVENAMGEAMEVLSGFLSDINREDVTGSKLNLNT